MDFASLMKEIYASPSPINMIPVQEGFFARSIKSVTVLTDVFPTGQKIVALIAEYDSVISNASLKAKHFCAIDSMEVPLFTKAATEANGGITYSLRTITKAYSNSTPERAEFGCDGRYVILELSPEDEAADTFVYMGHHRDCVAIVRKIALVFGQIADLLTVEGTVVPALALCLSSHVQNLIIDDFIQAEYDGLKYNLYIPKTYDPMQKYPLVQFIADSWELGPQHEISLAQGIGGVIWAKPEEQEKRPCFILVPQFDWPTIVEDDYSASSILETVKQLMDFLMRKYNIDDQRVYTTGQSMGTLASLELSIRYPDLFAGSLLFSGFWNPETVRNLSSRNIWLMLSEGDIHSYEVATKCVLALEDNGGHIDRAFWNASMPIADLDFLVKTQAEKPGNIKFTVLQANTMIPAGMIQNSGSNHRCTWQLAYQLENLRAWLFRQRKT